MFLSQLEIDFSKEDDKSRNWIKNPYRVHQRLWMAFDTAKTFDNEKAPFLYQFSLKKENNFLRPRILVLSEEKPDWNKAFQDFDVMKNVASQENIKELFPERFIVSSAVFRFSLMANPVKKVKFADSKLSEKEKDKKFQRVKSKKIGIYKESDQIEWLRRRGKERDGFELVEAFVENAEDTKAVKTKKNDRYEIPKIHTVTFSGILRVTDADAFRHAYTHGIGSGKAFGCGMLLLAKV